MSAKYKIEDAIPMPKAGCRKYPFAEMKAGQSFAFDEKERANVASSAYRYGNRRGIKFSTSKTRCYCVGPLTTRVQS